jgi:branched-chain amino acid transport system substrate-binding protein
MLHSLFDGSFRARTRTWSKRKLFLFILTMAAGVAGGIALLVHLTVLRPAETEIRVAVVAPLSGPEQAQGEQIRRGAALFVDQVNHDGGVGGRPLRLLAFDDENTPEGARRAAAAADAAGVVGVVGHWSAAAAAAAGELYQAHGLAALSLAADVDADAPANPWMFKTTGNQSYEIRFLANYVRNVIGEKTVSIIYQAGADNEALIQAFDEVMRRFGTKTLYRWDYDGASPDLGDRLKAISADIKDKKLIGSVLVLGDGLSSARVVAALRRDGISNRVVGPRVLATNAFHEALKAEWGSGARPMADTRAPASVASAFNGIVVTTPLLFDTAGELAQGFKNGYQKAHRGAPDWLAAAGFDAMRSLLFAHGRPEAQSANLPLQAFRTRIRDHLAGLGLEPDGGGQARLSGLFGPVAFDAKGATTSQIMIGNYDGADLVAALTQLSPIREENVGNYLDELLAGRALYANDRFMYKTNVIYSGIKLEKLSDLDIQSKTVRLDFVIWFRWRGALEPQDIVFTNAAEPIKLDKPDREVHAGDTTYRMYRAGGRFFMNYSDVERAYGTQVVGIAFHHRTLSRDNLMYVSDILGLDLDSGSTLAEQMLTSNLVLAPDSGGSSDTSLLRTLSRLLGSGGNSITDPLIAAMSRSRVLAGVNGWRLERAWISQDLSRRGAEGDPAFVGFGKPQSEFSQLDLGVQLQPDQIDPRDFISSDWFVILAIFSFVGAVVASLLDRKDRGQFWRMQTLGLRIVTWPVLLMSAGNLGLDYGVQHFSTATVDSIVLVYSALWWLVPARLMAISVERFLWVPLEIRTGRKVPAIIRAVVALVIYLFAFFGVVAFVMGKTVTSLLATSGLLAMIIGLAVQANIANVFSGIVLNIERPFQVGDYIKLNANVMGQVIDITWRTTRIRHLEGQLVCLANSKVSESEIHNFSDVSDNFIRLQLLLDPRYDPEKVRSLIREALDSFDIFINLTSNYFGPDAQFKGVECSNGMWVARYRVKFQARKGNDENQVINAVLARIWKRFQAEGIEWSNAGDAVRQEETAPKPALLAYTSPMVSGGDPSHGELSHSDG